MPEARERLESSAIRAVSLLSGLFKLVRFGKIGSCFIKFSLALVSDPTVVVGSSEFGV
jgi:hypothetical protein